MRAGRAVPTIGWALPRFVFAVAARVARGIERCQDDFLYHRCRGNERKRRDPLNGG